MSLLCSQCSTTQLLYGKCSRFDGFHRQKTEAPTELTIYMFTDLLLGLYTILTYSAKTSYQLHLVSLTYLCLHTLLPNVLTFICVLTSS